MFKNSTVTANRRIKKRFTTKSKKKIKKATPGIIPKDYADLVRLWDHRIDVAIRRYKMSEEEYEDLKQDIYTEFMERDYIGKIYDPKKGGAFSTFFYSFINTRALRRGCKVTTLKQKFVSNLDIEPISGDSISSDDSAEYGSIESKSIEYLTPNESIFWEYSLNNLTRLLTDPAKVTGFVLKTDGSKAQIIERSFLKLFMLLKDGWTKEDIAKEMDYSMVNVNSMIQEMRTMPEMIRLRETCHDISVVTSKSTSPQRSLEFPA